MPSELIITAKFASKCPICGYKMELGSSVKWDPAQKKAWHIKCPEPDYMSSVIEQKNIFDRWIERAKEMEELQQHMKGRRKE